MKLTEEHIEALRLLDQMRRDKFSASRFEVLKEAVGILQKQQGIQWNKYPETEPTEEGNYLVMDTEGTVVVWTWICKLKDQWGEIPYWAEINLPNK